MKHLILILSLTLSTCAVAQQSPGSSSARVTVIRAGTLLGPKSSPLAAIRYATLRRLRPSSS